MSAKVVPFRSSEPAIQPRPPSVAKMVAATRAAVEKSALHFDGPRLKGKMLTCAISMTLVIETLKSGSAVSQPKIDQYGEWTIELRRHVAGRTVHVRIALGSGHVSVVNVR